MAGSKAGRNRGHNLEREEVKQFKDIGFTNAKTSRNESRTRDALKIDLCNTGIFNVQTKSYSVAPNYHQIFKEMPVEPQQLNVICHELTKKSKGGKFMKKGKYYIMEADDFYHLLSLLAKYCPEEIGMVDTP